MNVPPKTLQGLTLTDSSANGHATPRLPDPDPAEIFPFALDPFQLEAIAALGDNCSVVVCAPTGSGKTLVGEYAIYRALAQGQRVFYTTPKKLSLLDDEFSSPRAASSFIDPRQERRQGILLDE